MKKILLLTFILLSTFTFGQEHKEIKDKFHIDKAEKQGNKNGWVYSNLNFELTVQQLQDGPDTYKGTGKLHLGRNDYTIDGYRFNGKL